MVARPDPFSTIVVETIFQPFIDHVFILTVKNADVEGRADGLERGIGQQAGADQQSSAEQLGRA